MLGPYGTTCCEDNRCDNITDNIVRRAFKGFAFFKATGSEGVFLDLLQRSIELIDVNLTHIFF